MAFVYLTEQGSVVKKTGERLIVEKDDQVLLDVECFKIEAVLIFGNIQVTAQALSEMLEQGIQCSFLTQHGKLKGALTPPNSKNIVLRMAQYEKSHDPAFCLTVSRAIVQGKIQNSLEVLRRFLYNHPEADLRREAERLEEYVKEAEGRPTLDSLRGLEGMASREYFAGLGKMILSEMKFPGRRRRPATDPVNALLSFGYTLVGNELHSLLNAMGFDPYLGFYHQVEYGRPSLALDILEEFRQPVVDRLTLTLVNKRILKEEDFQEDEETGAFSLKPSGMKTYFQHYESWLNEEFHHAQSGEMSSFRKSLRKQAEAMARTISKGEPYRAFYFTR